MKAHPLEVKIERGALVIRLGVETLAHAVTYSDWANPFDEKVNDYIRTFAITDAQAFAEDVRRAMLDEREDGSSPLTDFLDKATEAAVDDGSMACEFEQSIKYGTTAPSEPWGSAAAPGSQRTTKEDDDLTRAGEPVTRPPTGSTASTD